MCAWVLCHLHVRCYFQFHVPFEFISPPNRPPSINRKLCLDKHLPNKCAADGTISCMHKDHSWTFNVMCFTNCFKPTFSTGQITIYNSPGGVASMCIYIDLGFEWGFWDISLLYAPNYSNWILRMSVMCGSVIFRLSARHGWAHRCCGSSHQPSLSAHFGRSTVLSECTQCDMLTACIYFISP